MVKLQIIAPHTGDHFDYHAVQYQLSYPQKPSHQSKVTGVSEHLFRLLQEHHLAFTVHNDKEKVHDLILKS